MDEALPEESPKGASTETDPVADAKLENSTDDVVIASIDTTTEGTDLSGNEDVKQDDNSDNEDTFPFDNLDDFEVVDEVEDPIDDGYEAADKDEQKESDSGLHEGNAADIVTEETDPQAERSAEHSSQEEDGGTDGMSGNLHEVVEDGVAGENMADEQSEELKEAETVEEEGDEIVEELEAGEEEEIVEGEEGVEEEYEGEVEEENEEVEEENEEVEDEVEEEMEADEQEEYEEEEEGVEEENIEDEDVLEEEVEEDEEIIEGEEETIEKEEEVEDEEEAEKEHQVQEEQDVETGDVGISAEDNRPCKASKQNFRKRTAENLLSLQKSVIIYNVKPNDLTDVLLQPCLKKAICFCIRFLGPQGCMKAGHLEARFSSQKEAKEHMEVINSTIFKNGKKLKASILGPGGGPMDWLLSEWQRSISPAGIFESRCVFVSNVPSFAREEMLRALYPTAESVNLPLKQDGQTNGYAMLEFPTQEEAEEIVQHSETFQARIGNSNLKLTILGQTKIPSANESPPTVQGKSVKGHLQSDTGKSETSTEVTAVPVKATVKPKRGRNDSEKADSSTKSVPKKDDTKATKVSVKEKSDSKKVSSRSETGKKTSVKQSEKDKKADRKGKLSDISRKSRSKDDSSRGNSKARRDSRKSSSTSRRSERRSPERSSKSHRSTSSSRMSQSSQSLMFSDKEKVSSSSEKGKSSSKSVNKPKHKEPKPQADSKKRDLSGPSKKVSDNKAKNQGGQEINMKSGEQKKSGSGTIIPVQLGRTGNAAKRPIETRPIDNLNINRSDKRSRFDGPSGPYPMGMNSGPGGPIVSGNYPQPQSHMMRAAGPPNMMNRGIGRMPSQNFPPQNMMMGQSQPMSQPVPQPGRNPNMGPSMVPSSGAPGPDQPVMGPMYMGPGLMNQQQQQQGYGMDMRNTSFWPPNRNPGNLANSWDKPGGGRGESPEEIHNLRGELLKQLQVLETGNVSDPSDLSYIAQKLKQVQQSSGQGIFSGPQQGGFPPGPQGNYQQPQPGPQGNMQGNFQNAPSTNQQGNFLSQPNMQQQQGVYRDWPNQSGGPGPQGDPSNQYGYQSYSNNNNNNQLPGGMDSYHTARGSGMPGGMTPYDSDRGMDRRDMSVSQLKKLKTICVQNLPKPINYTELKKFIRNEMVTRNLCSSQDMPVIYVHTSKKGGSTIVFDTEIQANNALQLDGINFQGHILNIRKMWL